MPEAGISSNARSRAGSRSEIAGATTGGATDAACRFYAARNVAVGDAAAIGGAHPSLQMQRARIRQAPVGAGRRRRQRRRNEMAALRRRTRLFLFLSLFPCASLFFHLMYVTGFHVDRSSRRSRAIEERRRSLVRVAIRNCKSPSIFDRPPSD